MQKKVVPIVNADDVIKAFTATCLETLKKINDSLDETENTLKSIIAARASELPDSGYYPIKKSYKENKAQKALEKALDKIKANDEWQYVSGYHPIKKSHNEAANNAQKALDKIKANDD